MGRDPDSPNSAGDVDGPAGVDDTDTDTDDAHAHAIDAVDAVDGVDGEALGKDGGWGRRRGGRTGLVVSLVIALVAVGFVWVLATREPGTDRRADSSRVGQEAPPLTGQTLDGGTFDLADHRGSWVVVNAFATWCGPCRQEHPELVAFDEDHSRTGDVELVSVLFSDEVGDAREYFDRNGGEWPVVLDPQGRIAFDYGIAKVPETYIVNPDGVVVEKLIGGVTRQGLDGVIAEFGGGTPAGDAAGAAPAGGPATGGEEAP